MNRLKELRIKKNLKQKDIFDFMHIAKSTYSYWENGRTEPDQASLIKLANYYNVSVDYLIKNENNNETNNKNNSQNFTNISGGINGIINGNITQNTTTQAQLTAEEQELIKTYRELPKEKQNAIKELIKNNEAKQNEKHFKKNDNISDYSNNCNKSNGMRDI